MSDNWADMDDVIYPIRLHHSWWYIPDGMVPHVITYMKGDDVYMRSWSMSKGESLRYEYSNLTYWTHLPLGPPEPPLGSVYFIRDNVYLHTSAGHERTGSLLIDTWRTVKARHTMDDMATLEILRLGSL
jgi:hypothetical protein